MRFNEIFGNARFVSAGKESLMPQMRGSFNAEKDGEKTEITVCGLGFFTLLINGRKASDDLFVPATSQYHHYDECVCYKLFGEEFTGFRIYSMKYDISHLVKKGENILAVELGPGWYKPFGECKLCYKINCGEKEFLSDENIRWRDGSCTWYEFTFGENHDYSKADYNDGWELPGYDDSGWEKVSLTQTPDSEYYIQDCPADKLVRSLYPVLVSETEEYKTYDLGETITGWHIVKPLNKGEKIRVRVGERLFENRLDERWVHGQVCEYITDESDREYHPLFMWQAFSCVEISSNAELVRCDEIYSDTPATCEFNSDNEMLNWIYEAYVRTQLINMHAGIPSDCPHLEKRGYTGDGQLTCETVMLMFDTESFYKKWMEDISDCQDKISGHVQYTSPYIRSGGGAGGWGCAIAEVPYVYYKMYGDKAPMEKYYGQMLKYFEYLEAHSENDLIISDQPGQWNLGEWCTPEQKHGMPIRIPAPLVNNYFYIKTLNRVMEIAALIGKKEDIPGLAEVKRRKEAALIREYYDEKTGDFADNTDSADIFAADLGLGDERTLKNAVAAFEKRGTFDTGIFGTDIAVRLLFEKGYGSLATELLTTEKAPSFAYMKKHGATTLWENWFGPRSLCHPMFGAAVRYFFYYLLGIRQTETSAGFDEVIIDPKPVKGADILSGKVVTRHGEISVSIDRKLKNSITVTVPEGVKAVYKGDRDYPLSPGTSTFTLAPATLFTR